jgi:hypothetical protein
MVGCWVHVAFKWHLGLPQQVLCHAPNKFDLLLAGSDVNTNAAPAMCFAAVLIRRQM